MVFLECDNGRALVVRVLYAKSDYERRGDIKNVFSMAPRLGNNEGEAWRASLGTRVYDNPCSSCGFGFVEAQREPETRRCRTSSSAWISAAVKGSPASSL